MKWFLGAHRRRRLAGIFANIAHVVVGAGFVSYFFREGGWRIRLIALTFMIWSAIISVWVEPEGGD